MKLIITWIICTAFGGICGQALGTKVDNCINNAIINCKGNYIGGILGAAFINSNQDSSTILQNSINNGEVVSTGNYVGGIIGLSRIPSYSTYEGDSEIVIQKCINNSKVKGGHSAGGICGEQQKNGTIQLCINNGNVEAILNGQQAQSGGIAGYIGYTNSKVLNCYNTGNISSESGHFSASGSGGIVGRVTLENSQCSGSYSIGEVTQGTNKGGVCGYTDGIGQITNNYWISTNDTTYGLGNTSSNTGAEPKTADEMKQSSFIELLNTGNDEAVWVQDTNNINNGYPILAWQLED